MAGRRKRRRREERLEEQEPGRETAAEAEEEKERPREREDTPAAKVLELQKTAGNRAVGAALARWGLPWIPVMAAPQWPKEPQVILDGQVIPLDSWAWAESGHTGTGTGTSGSQEPHSQYNEINVMTTLGDHSSDLALSITQGKQIKTVVIVIPGKDGKGFTITLTDALITTYSISGRSESWGISFAKKEFGQSPPRAQPRG